MNSFEGSLEGRIDSFEYPFFLSIHDQIFVWIWLFPPGNGGCGGKIQENKSLLVHDPKLQTMIEKDIGGCVNSGEINFDYRTFFSKQWCIIPKQDWKVQPSLSKRDWIHTEIDYVRANEL